MSWPFDTVVIGASAGGIEALGMILPVLPPGYPASIIVVLHVPEHSPASLGRLFAAKCSLPVSEAEDRCPITPGTIYFAPPGYHTFVEADRAFGLSIDRPVNFSRPSIDVLFESAAAVYGPSLCGVVLSGANADGAAGLAMIGEAGGTTVVQDPATALAPQMPAAAIGARRPDHVLDLAGIAEFLERPSSAPRRRP